MSRNIGIRRWSVGRMTHDRFGASHREENNVLISLAKVFSDSVATQVTQLR